MDQKFWIVMNLDNFQASRKKFFTKEAAINEATQLLKTCINQSYFILEAMILVDKPIPTVKVIELQHKKISNVETLLIEKQPNNEVA